MNEIDLHLKSQLDLIQGDLRNLNKNNTTSSKRLDEFRLDLNLYNNKLITIK